MFPPSLPVPRVGLPRFSSLICVVGLFAAGALSGCGSPEDKAADQSRSLVQAFKEGNHASVCKDLTAAGRQSLVGAATAKEGGEGTTDCEAASRFLLDGTAAVGRNTLDAEGEPTDVDVTADGAKVQWEDCCSFELEELDGDYRVSDATHLALYFEAAGAGAGAGGGSPDPPDPDELEANIRANLKDADRLPPRVGFSRRVTEIRINGTRVTLVATTARQDNETIGICRVARGGEDTLAAGLPGVCELSIETSDAPPENCETVTR